MTFDQLLVFHKIVQFGSFKAAAGELRKTQSAISFSIKKLEEELDVLLFDRSSYRPTLTSHGKSFFERSLKILQAMSELEDGICLNPDLLKLLKSFSDQHPYTKLTMNFDILSEVKQKILAKETEIRPITHVKMVPVMSRELFKERKVKNQSDLLIIDQIVVADKNPKGASFGLLDDGKKWRLTDSNFKREIILAGMGWGHLPLNSVEREIKEKKVIVLDFEDIHSRDLEIYLIRLKKQHLGPIAKKLWEELISFHL